MSTMLNATSRAITPDGIPVRGGAGAMTVPRGLDSGLEMACGGANAIPTPKTFAYRALWYVLGQSAARHSSKGFWV